MCQSLPAFNLHNYSSSPMELHAVHFKKEYRSLESAIKEVDGVAVLVYAFRLQMSPNLKLEKIVENLPFIQKPNTSIRLDPLPLTDILRPFPNDYFMYWGSVPIACCIHTILWLVSREPIAISVEQVRAFRKLLNENLQPLVKNCRSLQETENRSVFHVNPSGSLYASLLPISRHIPNSRNVRSTSIEEDKKQSEYST